MGALVRYLPLLLLALPVSVACAGPAEDAGAVVERWTAAFNSNDADAVTKLYAPDAIVLGTVSETVDQGSEAIHAYFARAFQAAAQRGTAAKVELGERRTMVLDDRTVLVAGFYGFRAFPARFTMIVAKRGDSWIIAHHHSSRKPEPPK